MKKAFSLLLAAAMCTAMLAGCGSNGGDGNAANNGGAGGAENTASGAAFKLGGTGPRTGAAAIYGNAAKNGAQIAVDEINAEGGVIQV